MKKTILSLIAILTFGIAANSQTTEFTYQGSLKDGVNAASGNYDFEFRLFAVDTGGTALGTLQRLAVPVANGSFTAKLDFGAQFTGAVRYLEIAVRLAGGGNFTTLAPRQQISNAPYSVRSLNSANADSATNATSAANATNATTATNALQLGGVASGQYVLTADPRLSDARTPTAGSANYIQNGTATQASSNFNISGDGTIGGTLSAAAITSATQFNIGPNRVLSAPSGSVFLGPGAGANSTGDNNAFFGNGAGLSNNSGLGNSFFGRSAGVANTGGQLNAFFGGAAGLANITGSNNTLIGSQTNVSAGDLTFATAIGSNAVVNANNTIVLGRSAGQDAVQVPGALNITGAITGNGSNLTNLNAGNFTSGTLSAARGGTGLGSSGSAGSFLRSNGTNWASSALLAADIPPGSANYIQNSTTPQSSSNFNISGNGIFGGNLGIGTSSPPSQRLQIVSGTGNIQLGTPNGVDSMDIQSNQAGHAPGIFLRHTGTTGRAFRIASFGDNTNPGSFIIRDETAGQDRLTIDSTGKLFVTAPFVTGVQSGLTFQQQPNVSPNLRGGLSYEAVASGMGFNLGINTGREGPLYSFEPGFWLRLTTGPQTFQGFQFFSKSTGPGTESVLASIDQGGNFSTIGTGNFSGNLFVDGRIGIGNVNSPDKLNVNGNVSLLLAGGGGTSVCQNASFQLTTCGSSIRYKNNINNFNSGLDLIRRLRPVSFNWKQGGMPDMGLVAEEVADVEPLLVTHNDKGEIEGVKYDRVGVVAVNAIKEQQTQIEALQKQVNEQKEINRQLQSQMDALKKIICKSYPSADVCREEK